MPLRMRVHDREPIGMALRRLARTSCYFAKFVPDFPAFRTAVHQVRDLNAFRVPSAKAGSYRSSAA